MNFDSLHPLLKSSKYRDLFQDCVRIYQAIRRLPYLVNTLEKYNGENEKMIKEVFANTFQVRFQAFSLERLKSQGSPRNGRFRERIAETTTILL